ncbi:hypothetical protein ACTFO8_21835 [Bacillus cereus group sp. MYBK65-1]|uniref:hypothetical protein n=1 Tax=unclassified Bacillus cereus group TaxID=2750818 RepID=UPI002A566439|nr:hypothetical protein [Bacillus cereus]
MIICKALRKTLTNKYGICRGHVVSADGRKEGKKTDNPHESQGFLLKSLGLVEGRKFEPDLIVVGKNSTLCVGYEKTDQEEIQVTLFSPFHLAEEEVGIHYEPVIREKLTFGIALAYLLSEIDRIRLGIMPWEEILTDALSDE